MIRAELKKLQNRLWGKLNAVLGEDKMKSWKYKKVFNNQKLNL